MMKKQLLLLFSLFCFGLQAQLTPTVDSIPMSDGKKLAADVYIPSGMTQGPVILIQTPYNRQLFRYSLPLQIGLNLNSSNYIFVITDWRGFYGSAAAAYSGSPDQGRDGYSTVEWIAAQSWSNGKIGTYGASALGKVQFQTAKKNPPHLVCICPEVEGPQFNYNEYFPNGDLRTEYVQQLGALGYGLTPFLMTNPVRNNVWNYVENTNFYPDSIRVPCFMIEGWYDHNTEKMMPFFSAIRSQSPPAVRDQHRFLIGPWTHKGVGAATQGQLNYANAANKSDTLARQFFDYYLRNQANGWLSTPYVQYYQMGENTWKQSPAWPPTGVNPVPFYFHKDGSLDNVMPSNNSDSLSYAYDPNDPSPTVGGPTLRNDLNEGPYDQATQVESRNDILSFTTAPLGQNVILQGNAILHLQVASNRYDTDFDIRLTDVYPDGRSMLVNDGAMRMRFRNGLNTSDTSRIIPGTAYSFSLSLPNTAITFLTGHKIRVDITSSNYPRFNRNMNTDGPMYPGNNLDVLVSPVTATNTIYTNALRTSYISLPLSGYFVGIQETAADKKVSVYPNPAQDAVQVSVYDGASYQLKLLNSLGEVLINTEFQGSTSIQLNKLSQGIYFLEFYEPQTNQLVRRKLIKY
ncbi:MAG: CocE/NonD family hydrolase [Bacteroidetes bacterium]|nr:CocE/NonD family hydrolase [Bacteroidota bacterium]